MKTVSRLLDHCKFMTCSLWLISEAGSYLTVTVSRSSRGPGSSTGPSSSSSTIKRPRRHHRALPLPASVPECRPDNVPTHPVIPYACSHHQQSTGRSSRTW
ncbi:unnamed protein product [Pleuronectes platessa]|uniref:Uncharacterized protein n=1 Tax=Pleuronectes platessa TaxID=8262 RepID=A0A9N7YIS3_PLEPL|nr:unnamed protein product [Pleuronectes platessa]